MNELRKRISTALIGIPIALLLIYLGDIYFSFAVTIISLVTLKEFYNMAEMKGRKPFTNVSIILSFLYLSIFSILINYNFGNQLIIFSFIPLILIAVFFNAFALWKENINAYEDISITVNGFIFINLSFLSLILIRLFNNIDYSSNLDFFILVLSLFLTIWTCDSAAYFFGKAFGQHKLFPRHSPKKSWEGALAGFILGSIFFVIFNYYFNPNLHLITAIIIGTLISSLGQIGDLAESHYKRDAGVKDSSNFFPGHGGFFDRFDSILFISPIVLFILIIYSFM